MKDLSPSFDDLKKLMDMIQMQTQTLEALNKCILLQESRIVKLEEKALFTLF